MARRRHRRNPLAQFGYPGTHWLRQQALQLAQAGAPTQRSIRHEYGQQMGDVEGFTNALVSLLQGGTRQANQAFNPAIHQQRQIDQAAQDRLAALGPEYANLGAATAEGPLSDLISNRASARSYASRAPGIAASAGALQASGVADARTEALRQRAEGISQALPAIYNTLQQQALAQAQSNRDYSLQNRQFRYGKRQAVQDRAFQERQFAEQTREFNVQQKLARKQFIADQKASLQKSPYTPSQISAFRATASGETAKAINAGVGPQQFIDELIQAGVPREVASQSAAYAYGRFADRVVRSGNVPQFLEQNPVRGRAFSAYQAWVKQLQHMYGGKKRKRRAGQGFNPGR